MGSRLTMVLGVGVLVGVAHLVAHDLPVRARRG
jgi:hypothetical protein